MSSLIHKIFHSKTEVKIVEESAYINVVARCIRCGLLLHDIDCPKELPHVFKNGELK